MYRPAISISVLSLAAAAGLHHPPKASSEAPTAREIVLASAEAIGGVERLRSLRAVHVEETGIERLVSTETRREAPPSLIAQTIVTTRSASDSALRRSMSQVLPMRAGAFAATLVVHRGAAATVRGPAMIPANTFDLAVAEEELALSPERVLLTALDASDLRRGADTSIGGVAYRSVSFGFGAARVRLLTDASSSFPSRITLVRAYPTNVFWAMWGDLELTTDWSAWSLEANGVWYPRVRRVTLNGEPFRDYLVTALSFPGAIVPDSVTIADSVRSAFARRAGAEAAAAGRGGATAPLKPVMLADDVVLYEGGYQSAAVRQADGVVVIEAPESGAKSRAVLADVATRWPGMRVTGVITTSPMWMHIGGLREYAARGIPIHVLDVNAPIVRALVSSPHRQAPDSLARVQRAPTLRVVSGRVTIGSGDARLELVPARGQHASAMLLVWMPGHRLLYGSDVMIPPNFEPVFAAGSAAELARLVAREGWAVDRVFTEHLPATSWQNPR